MQSSFSIHEMDSASEPPSPMAAAASNKRKFRTCLRCPSRMPSFDFDSHTLCINCRNQVCDLDIHCDECRDWPVSKRKVFVNYNRGLKARRDSKSRRKARLSGTTRSSDQSAYDTDTDVPLVDKHSVPIQSIELESVVSQDCVVSESGGPSEAGPSEVFYVSSGDGFEKLASSLFSKFSEFQSDRGRPPQHRVIHLWVVLISLLLLIPKFWGSLPPLRGFIYLTLSTQFSGSPGRLCLTKPLIIGWSPDDQRALRWGDSSPSIALGLCFIPLQGSGGCEAVVSGGESPPFITAWGFVIFQAICCFYAWPARSLAYRRRPCIRWSI